MNPTPSSIAITVEGLAKSYGEVKAVSEVSFTVYQGEIFGLLGPNGAGKTTTLSILEGLRRADGGRAQVLQWDVNTAPEQVKRRIGVQMQSTSLLPDLTVIEQVQLFAELYHQKMTRPEALALLEKVDLAEKAGALPGRLSGGQRQRLAIALALINDPEIIFLDEPTSGLDPQSRRALWELIRKCRAMGKTIVLTTHYLEEAEALCHRVGIIDHGKLIALDTPGALIQQLKGLSTISTSIGLPAKEVKSLPAVKTVLQEGSLMRIQTDDVMATLEALIASARRHGKSLGDLHLRQPGLEDVFLHLTGRTIRDE
jgi:ABC-2 type transport system ATP-binding protein